MLRQRWVDGCTAIILILCFTYNPSKKEMVIVCGFLEKSAWQPPPPTHFPIFSLQNYFLFSILPFFPISHFTLQYHFWMINLSILSFLILTLHHMLQSLISISASLHLTFLPILQLIIPAHWFAFALHFWSYVSLIWPPLLSYFLSINLSSHYNLFFPHPIFFQVLLLSLPI